MLVNIRWSNLLNKMTIRIKVKLFGKGILLGSWTQFQWVYVRWGGFHTTSSNSQTQVEFSPTRLYPHTHFRYWSASRTSPCLLLCFWPVSYRVKVPMTPSLDFRCHHKSRLFTCNSDQLALKQTFYNLRLGFD